MATTRDLPEPPLDISEQIARIDKLVVGVSRWRQQTRLAPIALILTGMGAAAAFFAAAIAFAKSFVS